MDADAEAKKVLDDAFERGIFYLTDRDAGMNIHPLVSQWDNGIHPTDELERVMQLRKIALRRFSEKKIRQGEPFSKLEDVLVPIYFFHRYQITATAGVVGGLYYNHALRGGTQYILKEADRLEQVAALEQLLSTLETSNLVIPQPILNLLPPRTPGLNADADRFGSYTGGTFDPFAAAESVADLTIRLILDPARAARIVNQKAMNPTQLGFDEVIDHLIKKTFKSQPSSSYGQEVQRTVNVVMLNRLMAVIATTQSSPQSKAIATAKLKELNTWLSKQQTQDYSQQAHYLFCINQIKRFEKHPELFKMTSPVEIPQGAPIGGR